MRLSAGEVAALPYSCALLDGRGAVRAASPEWRGSALGALAYPLGEGRLVVVPDGGSQDLDDLVVALVREVEAAGRGMSPHDRMATRMYAVSLALVAGHLPPVDPSGTSDAVIEHCLEGVRRSGLKAMVSVEASVPQPVASPAAVGLALVQLVRNAERHAHADAVTVRVLPGATFRVEWRADSTGSARVATSRRPDQRSRWGMGFARLLADALGGVVTAPAPVGDGVVASALSLGTPRLAAPIAAVVAGRVERATRAWDEETGLGPGCAVDARVVAAIAAAAANPGRIGYADLYRARAVGRRTWVAISPQSSAGRARDVLRGMQHENVLLTAAEPHATRIYALATILARAVGAGGGEEEAVGPQVWARDLSLACAALGVAMPPALPGHRTRFPDPRVTAFLLASLGGRIEEAGDGRGVDPPLRLVAAPAHRDAPLVRLFGGAEGVVPLPT